MANSKVTGVIEEGATATVEFEFSHKPTEIYKRVYPKLQEALAKCSLPIVAAYPPSYCGHWPSEKEITEKKETGKAYFQRYDDGWRFVQ